MKTMEHPTVPDIPSVLLAICLTAFSWFMNFITNVDALFQLVLHLVQIIAACGSILVVAITIYPPLKGKISRWFK